MGGVVHVLQSPIDPSLDQLSPSLFHILCVAGKMNPNSGIIVELLLLYLQAVVNYAQSLKTSSVIEALIIL